MGALLKGMVMTFWIYIFIIVGGVLQACGAPMNGQLYKSLTNPWLADSQHRGWMFSNRLNKNFFLKRNRDRVLRGIDKLLSKPEIPDKSKTQK
ncbi:MAG TPA: hypothetical protein VGG19_13040 [Tepidisphaeraceae bacterium]